MFTGLVKDDILEDIVMHEFRKKPSREPRRALDGFLNAPARPQGTAAAGPQRALHLDGLRTSGRRMDDYRRAEGYHPVSPTIRVPATQEVPKAKHASQPSLLHMTLPGGHLEETKKDRKRKEKAAKRSTWRTVRKWSLRGGLAVGIVILLAGGFLGVKAFTKVHQVFKGGGQAAALQANVKPELLKGEGDGRINVLLLGKGGGDHEGPDLTDTILVASIDPVNKTADLVSIPRDLWVTVPSYGSMKINAVYANAKYHSLNVAPKDTQKAETAGVTLAEQTVTDVLGVPIHYYGMIDFHAFEQAVDTVGGVDITVPPEEALTDYMLNEDTRRPYTLSVPAGSQHFDGLKALMYARSRHASPRGDFDRTERQRLLIQGLSQKVLSAGTYTNPLKISQLMTTFGNDVSTDFSIADAVRLMQIGKTIPGASIVSIGLADPPNNYVTTDFVGSASVVRPSAGLGDYSQIQNYIRNTLRDPYLSKENANVTVLNGTTISGLATTKANELKSFGYNVGTIGDAPTGAYGQTVVVDLSKGTKPYTKNYLQKRFNAKAVTKLPDAAIQAGTADFVIILGQDAAASSQN